jgi:multiple sugar transport system substrate-binding protein
MTRRSEKLSLDRRELVKRSAQLGVMSSALAHAGLINPAAVLAQDKAVEIEFSTFYTGADGPIMQAIVDRFNQSRNDVRVNFTAPAHGTDFLTRLQTAALSGNLPAVVALHNYEIPPMAQFLAELNPEDMGLDRSNFADVAFDLPMYEDRLLGITMSTGTMGLFYNKDHFEAAGLDPESPPTNREEFIAAAQALTRDGRYGFVHDPEVWAPWYTFNWQAGGELLSEDGTEALFNTPEAIDAAQLSQDLVQEYGAALPQVAEDMSGLLYAGNVSMVFMGPWNLNAVLTFNEEEGGNIGWAKYPQFFEAEQAVHSTSHIYCVSNQADEQSQQLGREFIAWLLQEGSLEWAQAQAPTNLTVLGEMEQTDNPLVEAMALWVEQGQYARFPPYHPGWGEVSRLLTEAIQLITYQGAGVQETLDRATAQANEILARG